QSFTSIDGRVTDPTGGTVSGALVELTNIDTGLKRSAMTERAGLYSFAQIPPGNYSVSAQARGFASTTFQNVQLLVNTPETLNIPLEIGPVKETLAITTDAGQVNTVDAS